MKPSIEELLPNITTGITNKVLILEVYFLLRSAQSPIYFSLTDFVDNYSIDLIYIAVTFSLLMGWLMFFALPVYTVLAGGLAWCGGKIFSLFRFQGIPIFSAISQRNREESVSINVAKDYAMSNDDSELQRRIEGYEKTSSEQLASEALSAANFGLGVAIVFISYSTGAPNFLMKVASFADSFTYGNSYKVCIFLLVAQGVIGRASKFHLLHAAGSLPPSFFKSEAERKKTLSWVNEIVARNMPLAKKWTERS